jgi:hypothetical protein
VLANGLRASGYGAFRETFLDRELRNKQQLFSSVADSMCFAALLKVRMKLVTALYCVTTLLDRFLTLDIQLARL